MALQDKTLTCSDCGTGFTFTAQEQELFQQRGYSSEPKRCPECRQVRKSQHRNDGGYASTSNRQMYSARCARCGKDTRVPFEPHNGRPVYCSDCYRRMRPPR
ncbi:MAG: zinc-ribbon domain containing protein [Dehalococcoidia bacterium]|nr:zinc-ribbon domain containing protein [Dehalococcoidia bacterium]